MTKAQAPTREHLTQAMTLILIALFRGAHYGYAIMNEIELMTDGDYEVSAGTLYRSLTEMIKVGFVEEAPHLAEIEGNTDERRIYYLATHRGSKALGQEITRMQKLLLLLRDKP